MIRFLAKTGSSSLNICTMLMTLFTSNNHLIILNDFFFLQGETLKLPIAKTETFYRPPWFQVHIIDVYRSEAAQ